MTSGSGTWPRRRRRRKTCSGGVNIAVLEALCRNYAYLPSDLEEWLRGYAKLTHEFASCLGVLLVALKLQLHPLREVESMCTSSTP